MPETRVESISDPKLLEYIPEAAARTGLHRSTIHRYVRDGWLTRYTLGPRRVKVDPAEVDALLRSGGDAA